jgi:methyltransferase (TIGR00027 family)
VRARESQRPDRLFNDPWAAVLAGEEGQTLLDLASSHFNVDTTAPLIVRTRFFDDFLLRIINEQPVRQVVILAAGMDARGFRFSWPEQTQLFELDQPQVLALKEQILSSAGATPTCQRHAIGVNLNESWEPALLGCSKAFSTILLRRQSRSSSRD